MAATDSALKPAVSVNGAGSISSQQALIPPGACATAFGTTRAATKASADRIDMPRRAVLPPKAPSI